MRNSSFLFAILLMVCAACGGGEGKKDDASGGFSGFNGGAGASGVTGGTSGVTGGISGVVGGSGASGNGASGNGASGNGASGNGASGNGASGNGASGNGASGNGGNGADLDAGLDATTGDDAAMDAGEDAEIDVDSGITADWPPPPATTELAETPGNVAKAICDALDACLAPTLYEVYFDGAKCADRPTAQSEDGEFVYMQASIDAGRITFDKTKLADCFDAIKAQGCNVLSSRSPAACDDALHGNVVEGDACVLDNDCVTGLFCDRSVSCPGMCKKLLDANATCDRAEQCKTGLLCANAKCVAPAITGAACDVNAPPCLLGNLCVGADPSKSMAGMCQDQDTLLSIDVDQDCDPSVNKWCKDGLACVIDKQTRNGQEDFYAVCKARVATGAACNFSFAPEQCTESQYCPADPTNSSAPTYMDTCKDRPSAGQSCGPYSLCGEGLRCDGGKCRALARLDETCAVDEQCASGRCRAKKCAPPIRCRLDDAPPVCGDDSCDANETCSNCARDCGECPPVCGNQKCETGETCKTCAGDCGQCPASCGDAKCDASETCKSCAADCGACPAPYSGPCTTDAQCGPDKKCVQWSVFTDKYGYCAETCSNATTCSGPTNQRSCTVSFATPAVSGTICALSCNPLGLNCPTGMVCSYNYCTWKK